MTKQTRDNGIDDNGPNGNGGNGSADPAAGAMNPLLIFAILDGI